MNSGLNDWYSLVRLLAISGIVPAKLISSTFGGGFFYKKKKISNEQRHDMMFQFDKVNILNDHVFWRGGSSVRSGR